MTSGSSISSHVVHASNQCRLFHVEHYLAEFVIREDGEFVVFAFFKTENNVLVLIPF